MAHKGHTGPRALVYANVDATNITLRALTGPFVVVLCVSTVSFNFSAIAFKPKAITA